MYIPVMKNRTVEVSVLQKLAHIGVFDENVIPLLELIQERTRSNMKSTFIEELQNLLQSETKMSVMIDFFKSAKLRNTTDSIRDYISKVVRQPEFCYDELDKLVVYSDRVIPVVSYLNGDISTDRIIKDTEQFQNRFRHIAFRLRPQDFNIVYETISAYIREGDFLILDIGSSQYTSPVFKQIYREISTEKKQKRFKSIIINSHRQRELTNISMVDKEPIAEIDNSLKDLYNSAYMSKFDGFGDYATINAELPSKGGRISPVGIYYSNENNFFVAFKGRVPLLSEFPEYIAPSIVESEYWEEFPERHHEICPGCREIKDIIIGIKSGKNQAQWKMIAMLHYIFSMYEQKA